MKKLWSIPIALAYLYGITILTQYGYYAYFNIPTNFIDASIPNNTIYAYALAGAIWGLITSIPWWAKVLIGAAIVLIGFLSFVFFNNYKTVFIWSGTIIAILFLCLTFNLGTIIAETKTSYLTLSPGCPAIGQDAEYIAPDIYEGQAIFVPIDPQNKNKLGDGFILKDISSLSCKLEYSPVGQVTK